VQLLKGPIVPLLELSHVFDLSPNLGCRVTGLQLAQSFGLGSSVRLGLYLCGELIRTLGLSSFGGLVIRKLRL
jgi:hypothetical protein